jgi:toxin-antitoxin system PIN domain toxin
VTNLLDVSVLLALVDPAHVHHNRAHGWLDARRQGIRWATCALTENGFCRISSSPAYPGHVAPGAAVRLLNQLRTGLHGHEFWPCSLSLTDRARFDLDVVQGAKQLTDIYLLGLAVARKGIFATFDRRTRPSHAVGARTDHLEYL